MAFAGYMHDFILTPRYLVALNSSLLIGNGETFVDSMHWEGERPSEVLVFDRADFSLRARVEVPPAFVFHFGNGWEEDGEILFTACQYEDASIVERMGLLAQQRPGRHHQRSELLRYRVAPRSGRVSVEAVGVAMEFPGFDKRFPFRAQTLYGVSGDAESESGLATAIVAVDPKSGAQQRYDYGAGTVVEEPLFIAGADGGHLLHTWLDYRAGRSGLSVLRAGHIAEGPIATAYLDRTLPLGFHGSFLPRS
jgi:carotenoid cleavage dioxygenase-like enzyme